MPNRNRDAAEADAKRVETNIVIGARKALREQGYTKAEAKRLFPRNRLETVIEERRGLFGSFYSQCTVQMSVCGNAAISDDPNAKVCIVGSYIPENYDNCPDRPQVTKDCINRALDVIKVECANTTRSGLSKYDGKPPYKNGDGTYIGAAGRKNKCADRDVNGSCEFTPDAYTRALTLSTDAKHDRQLPGGDGSLTQCMIDQMNDLADNSGCMLQTGVGARAKPDLGLLVGAVCLATLVAPAVREVLVDIVNMVRYLSLSAFSLAASVSDVLASERVSESGKKTFSLESL